MKTRLYFLIAFLGFNTLFSQKFEWSKFSDQLGLIPSVNQIIGQDSANIYAFAPSVQVVFIKQAPLIVSIDKTNKKIKSINKIKVPEGMPGAKEQQIEALTLLKNNFLVFTSYYDKKADQNMAFVGKLNKTTYTLAEIKELDIINATAKKNPGNFAFALSRDSTKILVYHNEPYKKSAEEKFAFKVFDGDLNLIWEKTVQLPFKDKEVAITNCTLDDKGTVYILAAVGDVNKEKKYRNAAAPYKYVILSYTKEGSVKEYEISLENKLIHELSFRISKEGDLVCAGYYSALSSNSVAGTFYMRINSLSKNIISSNHQDFDAEFVAQVLKKSEADEGDELRSISLKNFLLADDGGAVLIGEKYYVKSYGTRPGGSVDVDHYDQVIITKIDPPGTIKWSRCIEKYQYMNNNTSFFFPITFLSVSVASSNNNIYILFNDNIKNVEARKEHNSKLKTFKGDGKFANMCAVLTANGEIEYKVLNTSKEHDAMIIQGGYRQIGSDELILLGTDSGFAKYFVGSLKLGQN